MAEAEEHIRDEPLPDDHLLLGITYTGLCGYLKRIGFPYMLRGYDNTGQVGSDADCEESALWSMVLPSTYECKYRRSPKNKWITENYGSHLTGYDLVECVEAWLNDTGNTMSSVCEVMRREGNDNASRATVFLSHVQSKSIGYTMNTMIYAPTWHSKALHPKDDLGEIHWWLDYVVLRQCVDDFDVNHIWKAIKTIGVTVAEVDTESSLLDRSFCIFEMFATASSGAKLLVLPENYDASVRLASSRVDSHAATSRDPRDKERVDAFIRGSIGHAAVDETLMRVMRVASDLKGRATAPPFMKNSRDPEGATAAIKASGPVGELYVAYGEDGLQAAAAKDVKDQCGCCWYLCCLCLCYPTPSKGPGLQELAKAKGGYSPGGGHSELKSELGCCYYVCCCCCCNLGGVPAQSQMSSSSDGSGYTSSDGHVTYAPGPVGRPDVVDARILGHNLMATRPRV
mmetsp:Transcript_20176/g.55873  ORF Transcript_20176/g.55873 Transcript_20176/m.55873 type:complete len:456 (+) Transcript_20176:119-1486(+)